MHGDCTKPTPCGFELCSFDLETKEALVKCSEIGRMTLMDRDICKQFERWGLMLVMVLATVEWQWFYFSLCVLN